jgi:hypothetical protein
MEETDLPFIDRHCVEVRAPKGKVWIALGEVLTRGFGGIGTAKIAGLLGTKHRSVTGPPLVVGSSVVGFRVVESQPERHVVLAGEHRFSRYTLAFDLEDDELCATTHAEFPRFRGAVYRAVLLGARGHVVATKHLLRLIKKRAEEIG